MVHRAEETIRRWIWAGRLPARKLATGYRVLQRDVAAVAAGRPLPEAPRTTLRDWVSGVTTWQACNGVAMRGGAGRLVIDDRTERSDLGGR